MLTVWLQNFEDQPKSATLKENMHSAKDPTHQSNTDYEILLIEEDEENDEANEDNVTADEETELFFERYMKDLKYSGFRRTTPAGQPQTIQDRKFACQICKFIGKDNDKLKECIRMTHSDKTSNSSDKTDVKQRNPQFFHYWNNYGSCNFEFKNGRPCKFEHKTAPRCRFDGNCDRKLCMYVHINQNMSFLANGQTQFNNIVQQRNQRGHPQRMNQFGRQQGGN